MTSIAVPPSTESYGRHDRKAHEHGQEDAVALLHRLGVDVLAEHRTHRASDEVTG